MRLDARDILPGQQLSADMAVVGAGPAGLALSLALARAGCSVILLESGGLRPDADGDALNAGTSNLTDYPFQSSRARALGGSTTRWFGACIPPDPEDFVRRDWVPNSGWPITFDDLGAEMAGARAFFGLPDRSGFEDRLASHPMAAAGLEIKPVLFSSPLDLGKAHSDAVARTSHLRCILGATVTEVLQQMPGCVEALKVQRADGAAFEVVAKHYVLAAGGLETPRLLLASRALAPNGLGNAHDVVGRYHMEHPIRSVGVVSLTRRARGISDFTEIRAHQTVRGQATLGLPTVARRANGLLDLHARAYRFHPLERDAVVMSAKALLGVGQPPPGDRHLSLRQVFAGSGKVIRYGAWHYRQKLWPKRMPSHLRLLAFVEQEPDPDNRITLSRQKDRFGTPLPHLTHNESAKMRRSIDKTMELIDHRFRQSGIGTLDYAPETLDDLKHHNGYGLHPMGSTRMSADPQTGVVDANLKVHGIANLHIVGSSVFPTGGAANPTLSIVALALRLARHLSTL